MYHHEDVGLEKYGCLMHIILHQDLVLDSTYQAIEPGGSVGKLNGPPISLDGFKDVRRVSWGDEKGTGKKP